MTDEQTLYAALAALYAIECGAWVPRGAAAFIARAGSSASRPAQGKLAFPRRGLSNNRGGFVLGNLWPGGAGTFIVPQWPLSLGRGGVLGWVAESLERDERARQTATFHAWQEAPAIETQGRTVLLAGDTAWTAPSGLTARRVAAVIKRFRDLSPEARAAALDALIEESLDTAKIKQRLDEFEKATASLRTASTALFLGALAVTPAVVLWIGLEMTWPFILAGIYVLAWTVAALFARAHKRLEMGSGLERWGQSLLLALLPLNAMRAADALSRGLLHGFHPLAVTAVLAPREQLVAFAGHLVRDLRNPRRPICLPDEPEAIEIEAEYRAAWKRGVERFLEEQGIDAASLLEPPAADEACAGYCPRCLAQYGADIVACEDCGGVPVLELSSG